LACPLIIFVLVSINVWNTAVSTFYFMCIIVVSINYMHLYFIHVLKIAGGMGRDWGRRGKMREERGWCARVYPRWRIGAEPVP
jgi:hypothetical protein